MYMHVCTAVESAFAHNLEEIDISLDKVEIVSYDHKCSNAMGMDWV